MRLLRIAITTTIILSSIAPAMAGDVNQNGELGLFTLRSGYTYGRGEWGFSLYANEWDWRVPSDRFWKDFDPLWSNWDLEHRRVSAGFGFGVTDKVEIDVRLPYESYSAYSVQGPFRSVGHLNGRTFVGEIDSQGIGDLRVGARFALRNTDQQGLSLNTFVDLPTGDDDEAVVTGEVGYGLGLAWSAGNWVVNGGYRDPGEPGFVQDVPLRGPIEQGVSPRVELGLGYGKPFGQRWVWISELSGSLLTQTTGEYDTADIASGGRYRFGDDERWAFNFALRLDLSHNDFGGSEPLGGLIGITYSSAGGGGAGGAGRRDRRQPPPPAAPSAPPVAPPPAPPAPPQSHGLSVRTAGTGNGTVTSTPPGIDCGSDCRETYPPGTEVRLAGKPDACSTLTGFGGDCKSDGSVTMSSDRSCIANFDARTRPTQTIATCAKYGAWDCQTGLRETVPFASGTAVLAESAASDGRGLLCDWANQLRACPALRLCVAGSNAATEDSCVGVERADVLVEFFRRQSGQDAFRGITSRVQAAPSCSPDDEKGSLGNLLLR